MEFFGVSRHYFYVSCSPLVYLLQTILHGFLDTGPITWGKRKTIIDGIKEIICQYLMWTVLIHGYLSSLRVTLVSIDYLLITLPGAGLSFEATTMGFLTST